MTYRNRVKKPKSNRGVGWGAEKYFEAHKIPYLTRYYSDTVDGVSGKFLGWRESSYKEKGLRKQIRREGKNMIERDLLDMFDDPEQDMAEIEAEEEQLLWAEEAEEYRRELRQSHMAQQHDDYNAKWDLSEDPFRFGNSDSLSVKSDIGNVYEEKQRYAY